MVQFCDGKGNEPAKKRLKSVLAEICEIERGDSLVEMK
jgi:hypothetical protein